MTGRQTRAERAAYPLARDSIRKIAEASGGCLRPVQLRRTDTQTGQIMSVMVPCVLANRFDLVRGETCALAGGLRVAAWAVSPGVGSHYAAAIRVVSCAERPHPGSLVADLRTCHLMYLDGYVTRLIHSGHGSCSAGAVG